MLKPEDIKPLKGKRKLTMLTAYDYPTARILCKSGIDMILVGDSLGVVVLGQGHTRGVTLNDTIRHTAAVVRGGTDCMVIADMPINTTDTAGTAISNCRMVMEETGAHAVKLEGDPHIVEAVVKAGIPVMGHAGLKLQSTEEDRVCGIEKDEAEQVRLEALALEKAGVFALVLRCVPTNLAKSISDEVKIPTIGMGAGKDCDGQALVVSEMIGLFGESSPKYVRRYAEIGKEIDRAARVFIDDVRSGVFPSRDESYCN